GPAAVFAVGARRRGVLAGKAQRSTAEIVGQPEAIADFAAQVGVGGQIAHACAPVPDGVPAPGATLRGPWESMHAFVGEQEYRLVVQLVVPAMELVAARDLVHTVLYGLAQGCRTDDADAQVRGVQ